MKNLRLLLLLMQCIPWALYAQVQNGASSYLITNNDLPVKTAATSGTVFTLASDGTPQNPFKVTLGGSGAGGGYFTANRVSLLQSSACVYLPLGGAGEIGGVDISALQDVGNFPGSSTDVGVDNGIGLANNGTYLYASFSTSNTIATFAVLPGCTLNFLGDISPLGKQSGNVKGMAVRGNMLVVAYGDGSIESFDVSAGIPVSHGDLQYATGYLTSRFPTGVDITADGHFAIFGDQASTSAVEVSDISSGKLAKTVLYNLSNSGDSTSIYLSPDETLLYVANTSLGKVSAAFFNKTTGTVTRGCTSATLRGFDSNWVFLSSPVTFSNTGTGSVLYLAEYGTQGGIAMLNVSSTAGRCSLTESSASPISDPDSSTLLSIGVYPPRQF